MYIMVLEDGETFTALEGCAIWKVNDDLEAEDVEFALQLPEGSPDIELVMTFGATPPPSA